jgi:hypothetical protein
MAGSSQAVKKTRLHMTELALDCLSGNPPLVLTCALFF